MADAQLTPKRSAKDALEMLMPGHSELEHVRKLEENMFGRWAGGLRERWGGLV